MARKKSQIQHEKYLPFMERVRQNGALGLKIFLIVFLVSVFAGLGVGGFTLMNQAGSGGGANQAIAGEVRPQPVSTNPEMLEVSVVVNGEGVPRDQYYSTFRRMLGSFGNQYSDPESLLQLHSFSVDTLVRREVLRQMGDEMGVKVTNADINEARNEAIQMYMGEADDGGGNIIGDVAKNLSQSADRKRAFQDYLQANGIEENTWMKNIRGDLLIQKTIEQLQEQHIAEREEKNAAIRAEISERLADGESFSDMAKEFSEDTNAAEGGDMISWMQRDLFFFDEQKDAAFNTPVGETSAWFEVTAGWQMFEVYERKSIDDPEFAEQRDEVIAGIREERGNDSYEPSDEELAAVYEEVKLRQILLKKEEPGASQEIVEERIDNADIQINEPYALAHRALTGRELDPMNDIGFGQLESIANTTAVGEGYDFTLINDLLIEQSDEETEAETASEDDAAAEDEPTAADSADDTSESTEDASAEGSQETEADGGAEADDSAENEISIEIPEEMNSGNEADAAVEEESDLPVPVYALAVGLMKSAVQTDDDVTGSFGYHIISYTYEKWMDDTMVSARQPINRDAAREEMEKFYARAAEKDEYNAELHASRGQNLAWLEKPEEADESLQLALKYTSAQLGNPVISRVREAYEVLDNEERLAELEELEAEMRQNALREQIEAAQQGGQDGGPGNLIIDGQPVDVGSLDLPNMPEAGEGESGAGEGDSPELPDEGSGGTEPEATEGSE